MLQLHQSCEQERASPVGCAQKFRVAEAMRPGMFKMTSICATLANLMFQKKCSERNVNINPMLRRSTMIVLLASTIVQRCEHGRFSSVEVNDLSGRLTVCPYRCVSAANRTPPANHETWRVKEFK